MFLGAMYLLGEGVGRDLAQAYAWCDIAQSSGAMDALGCRDEAARQMTPSQVEAANKLTAEWYGRGPRPEGR